MIEDIKFYLKNDPFWGFEEYYKIDTETHRYVWGDCLVNKDTGVIDRMISKDKKYVGDVKYIDCIFSGVGAYEVHIAGRFIGYITRDYSYSRSMMDGGGYWLNGILKAYQILRQDEESRQAQAEWNSTVET